MRPRRLSLTFAPFLRLLASAAYLLSLIAPVQADSYRTASNGTWSDLNVWEIEGPAGTWTTPTAQQGVPDADDCVTVRMFHLITVDKDTAVECLTIEAVAEVDFEEALSLTISGKAGLVIHYLDAFPDNPGTLALNAQDALLKLTGGGQHTVNGVVEVAATEARLRIESNDSEIGGTGRLLLTDSSSAVEIEAAQELAIGAYFTLAGQGRIRRAPGTAPARFRNMGRVIANQSHGQLMLESNVALSDVSGAQWIAAEMSDAVLYFTEPSGDCGLHGDFIVESGATLRFDHEMRTSGGFVCLGGAVAGTLLYNCNCDSARSSCSIAASCP